MSPRVRGRVPGRDHGLTGDGPSDRLARSPGSSLHSVDDHKVVDKVVVITDRFVLDRQLQETIYQFEHTHGVVEKHVRGLRSRRYAVIIDEAHSSQTADSAKEKKKVLGGGLADPMQHLLTKEVDARGKQANRSFFAFTATHTTPTSRSTSDHR